MNSVTEEHWVKRSALAWLLIAQTVVILPLFFYLPLWLPVLWLACLLWRIQIYRGAWAFPSNRAKAVLGGVCIVALLVTYSGIIGVEPLVAFLLISFVLKLIEVRSRSDVLVIIYVGFITVAAQFLFYQTIFIAVYGSVSVILLLCAWNCIYRSHAVSPKRQLWASTGLVLQSLPLMVLLFLVLPRVGSLWHVPLPQKTGVTGFSDTMAPGDFSALSQSGAVAFRVTFDEINGKRHMPDRQDWYWRGLILDDFDGRNWKYDQHSYFNMASRSRGAKQPPDSWGLQRANDSSTYNYKVLMEPHQQQWLFTLMAPVSADASASRVSFAPNYLLKSRKPVASRTQYHVASVTDYLAAPGGLTPQEFTHNTALPKGSNPRAHALAQEWRKNGLNIEAIVNRALGDFAESFTYTLRPPPLGTHSVDEFLFVTRKGFCEHFASSFVVLMRAAGIPARVVVGYQGGEWNPIENYVIVRQSDAHAWAEVWMPQRGWLRVDPTAAVSPLRIERGLEASLETDEDRRLLTSAFSGRWLSALQLRADAMSYSWHQWVLGYDNDTQQGIFKRWFGGIEAWRIGAFFIASVGAVLLLYFVGLTWKGKIIYSYPEQRVYATLLKKLARKGYAPEPGETPSAFTQRVGRENKQSAAALQRINLMYTRIAYEGDKRLLAKLRDEVRRLKLN